MAGPHQVDTKEFGELSFAEQANSITATINNLQAAIAHHVEHSPRRQETIAECLAQVDRLRERLQTTYARQGAQAGSGGTVPVVDATSRIYLRSPRLADPARAVDFTMEVTEEPRDAGLR